MDSHVYPDYVVPPSYDSLLEKLLVWAPTREKAISRMKRALSDTIITGVPTTIEYHKLILDNEDFKNGNVDTAFIPKYEHELAEVYDMRFELNEMEATRELYPSTISFLKLLNALIAEEINVSDRRQRILSMYDLDDEDIDSVIDQSQSAAVG